MFVWYDINSNLIDKDLVQIPFIVYTTIYAGHQKEHANGVRQFKQLSSDGDYVCPSF